MGTHRKHRNSSHRRSVVSCTVVYPAVNPQHFLEHKLDARTFIIADIPNCSDGMSEVRAEADRLGQLLRNTPFEFCTVLNALANDHHCPPDVLAFRAGLSQKRVDQILSGQAVPPLETVLALCIGLNLHPVASLFLIASARHGLDFSPLHLTYLYLIWFHHGENLHSWNQKLQEAGFSQKLPYGRKK